MERVIPKPGKVGFESCRLVHGLCDFWKAWHRGLFLEGTWPELPSYCYGFQRARGREGAVASHLALAARCRHESISFVDESLDMANASGSLDRKNEDVIQPRLREIDRFFFNTRGRRLFTEVLAPDGTASGLAQVGLFMGDKNAPDEFGAVFQGEIDTWQASVTKKNGGTLGLSPYQDDERSCGVTLFADDVLEKSLLEKGTADECEHTVARRMGEANSALETCGLRQNAGKLVILPSLRRTVENRRFSQGKQEYQIKAVYPAMLSMGAEIDQRIWATNRAWRDLYGMWWNKKVPYKTKRTLFRGAVCGASLTGLTALLHHDRDYLRLQRCVEKKAPRAHARNGFMGRTRPHKDPQLSPSVEKVAVGASCIRALCTKAQMVPEHCQGARTSCTSSLLLVWPNALRIARHTH